MKLSLILLFIRPYYNLQLAFLFLYLGWFVSKQFPPSFMWISVALSCDLTIRSAGSCYLVWPALSPRASSTFIWWKEGVPACQSGRQELPPHAPWEHSLLVSSLWFDWWTFTPLSWKETKTPELGEFGRNMIFVVCFFSQVAGKWNRSNCKNEHWCPYQLESDLSWSGFFEGFLLHLLMSNHQARFLGNYCVFDDNLLQFLRWLFWAWGPLKRALSLTIRNVFLFFHF